MFWPLVTPGDLDLTFNIFSVEDHSTHQVSGPYNIGKPSDLGWPLMTSKRPSTFLTSGMTIPPTKFHFHMTIYKDLTPVDLGWHLPDISSTTHANLISPSPIGPPHQIWWWCDVRPLRKQVYRQTHRQTYARVQQYRILAGKPANKKTQQIEYSILAVKSPNITQRIYLYHWHLCLYEVLLLHVVQIPITPIILQHHT